MIILKNIDFDMDNLKISLIIPAYNEEKYIGMCLEYAIKNAGDKLLEIIVINNASSDRTQEIAEKYKDVRVVLEEKKGLTRARQCGFKEARGDVLAYIDADTQMPSDWFDVLITEFKNNPNLACLSGPYVYYDVPSWQSFFIKFLYWYILAMPMYWIIGYMAVGGNFAIRKDVLVKMNGFDTTIEFYGEDTDIARRAHEFGKVKFKPGFLMYTSGRRLAGQGLFKTGVLYVVNFFSEIFRHKPASGDYKDIR